MSRTTTILSRRKVRLPHSDDRLDASVKPGIGDRVVALAFVIVSVAAVILTLDMIEAGSRPKYDS